MTRALSIISTLFCMILFFAPAADAKSLTIDMARSRIDITMGFNGANVTLYGVKKGRGAVAVTIAGPERSLVVRRKARLPGVGIWANTKAVVFKAVPAYYNFALDRPTGELAPAATLKEYGIGFPALKFDPAKDENIAPETLKAFQQALLRRKQDQELFPGTAQAVTYLDDAFFRVDFYIPPDVPTGLYKVKTYLIDGGRIQVTGTTQVNIAQKGTNAAIYRFAHEWSFAYGLLCVLFAMTMGWLSNSIRRRR